MAGPRYTEDELLNLRESPLVPGKPERLPSIKQWCEPDRKTRDQTQQSSKGDENDQPIKQQLKRPALLGRQSSRQQAGEEIFLGPRISFASARQPGRNEEESRQSASTDESKTRFSSRDKAPKEREGREKGRYERGNGASEGIATNEGRGYGGFKKVNDKSIDEDEDGAAAEEAESRRRAKLDQPWFRGGRTEGGGLEDSLEPSTERAGWRDRDRERERDRRGERGERNDRNWQSGGRVEQDPQWMKEGPVEADITLKTEADFEAWKQAMKGNNAKDEEEMMAAESSLSAGSARKPAQPTAEQSNANDFFNLWSEPKREALETSVSTPKTTSKPKSSRFAGFFGPTASEPQHQIQEPARAPSPSPPPHVPAQQPLQAAPLDFGGGKRTNEDQEGFQKVMQMLRLGNGSAQNAGALPFGGPPSTSHQAAPQQQAASRRQTSVEIAQPQQQMQPQPSRQSTAPTAKQNPAAQQPLPRQTINPPMPAKQTQPPPNAESQRPPPPVNRDSEFLLKLMQQPRVPFAEGQIYGQGYNSRKDPAEIASLLGNLNVGGQRGPALSSSGLPPGMQFEERGYPPYQQQMQGRPKQPPQMHMDDRTAGMPSRQLPPHDEQRFQQQAPPPGFDPRQHLGRQMMPESVAPPPGFGRGPGPQPPQPPQMPPGFFQQQRGMPHGQQVPPPGYYPQAMPPSAGIPNLPPGFMQGLPPGMPPPPQQSRRHPSMSMQPGFDVHGGIDVYPNPPRGVQQQQQQQYQQYMK